MTALTNDTVIFILVVLGSVGGLWFRIENAISRARVEATTKAETAAALASLIAAQLAEYKIHVAETYISKAGHREATEQIMTSLNRIEGRVDGMSKRMDSIIEVRKPRERGTP